MVAGLAPTAPQEAEEQVPTAAVLAMAWSVVAGCIHLLLAPAHLAEAWYLGAFFLAVGVAQVLLAFLVRRPLPTALLLAALAGTVAVVALYVASRTMDLWFLPAHGHGVEHLPVAGGVGDGVPVLPGSRVEPVGPLDLLCLAAELVVVATLTALLPERLRGAVTSVLLVGALAGTATVLLLG